jgi:heat shock protein HslJ
VATPTLMRATLVALAAMMCLPACGDEAGGAPASPSFRGVPWELAAGIDVAGWEDVAPSATFEQGRVTGSTGCNRFTAPYTLDAEALTIGAVATTQMACTGAADAVERAFLAALKDVAAWRIERDQLVLLGDGGAELLRFRVPTPTGTWTATAILAGDAVSSPLAGTEMTATFADDGKLTGSAGCNRYTTTYRASRGEMTIAEPATTKKACATPEGVMKQERAYLAALSITRGYRVEGSRLSLLTAEGTFTAIFERVR